MPEVIRNASTKIIDDKLPGVKIEFLQVLMIGFHNINIEILSHRPELLVLPHQMKPFLLSLRLLCT
jgi:hypothetical protein